MYVNLQADESCLLHNKELAKLENIASLGYGGFLMQDNNKIDTLRSINIKTQIIVTRMQKGRESLASARIKEEGEGEA